MFDLNKKKFWIGNGKAGHVLEYRLFRSVGICGGTVKYRINR